MNKVKIHAKICEKLTSIYEKKNHDYGDAFAKLRMELPGVILVRIYDKYSRLKTLIQGGEQKVKDESIEDTLMDLANYCLLELTERHIEQGKENQTPCVIQKTPQQTIYICSQLRGDIEGNRKKAAQYCLRVALGGRIPFAPHLYFTEFLDDRKPIHRALGLEMGIAFLKTRMIPGHDELWIFGNEISEGMKKEIAIAQEMGIEVCNAVLDSKGDIMAVSKC